ncbi:TraM recognition domain-containing protein [Thermostaphylospora chromogena]|uniref:TraM recognition domain-containing protein n=1 Tax=Thermostaphylospora chromogena TaxID=35622 RepID=UPI0010425543
MELDEVANVTPIPIAAWASYAAGSGIRLSIYTQAWGQIVARWGTHAADTLWQTATCKVLMSGCSEDALLRRVSTLCGRTSVVTGHVERHDGRRRPVRELVDVMPPDAVRRLPAGYALVILDNARPTIVRTETGVEAGRPPRMAAVGPTTPAPAAYTGRPSAQGCTASQRHREPERRGRRVHSAARNGKCANGGRRTASRPTSSPNVGPAARRKPLPLASEHPGSGRCGRYGATAGQYRPSVGSAR